MKGAFLDWIRSVAPWTTSSSVIDYETRYELGDLRPDSLVTKYLLLNNSLAPAQIPTNVTAGTTPITITIPHPGMSYPAVQMYDAAGNEYTGATWADDGTNIIVTAPDNGTGKSADTFLIVVSGTTSTGTPPPGITQLTGDVVAGAGSGSQVATIAQINGHNPAFYDPSSSIQTQINGKQANLGFTPYDSSNPAGYISGGSLGGYALILGINTPRTSANPGHTATLADVGHFDDPGTMGDNTYSAQCWLYIISQTGSDAVTMEVLFTYAVRIWTKTFVPQGAVSGVLSTPDYYPMPPMNFRVTAGTTIQISAIVSGTGSINYECGCTIELKK